MRLEKFLFCMTVETASLAIGFFGVFVTGFILLMIVGLTLAAVVALSIEDTKPFDDAQEGDSWIFNFIFSMIVSGAIISSFYYMNVLLLKGIRNNQHEKLESWLAVNGICNVLTVIILYILSFVGVDPVDIATLLSVIVVHIYCYIAVYSQYQNMKEMSLRGLNLSSVLTVGFLMPNAPIHVAEQKQSEPKDFNYMKLV